MRVASTCAGTTLLLFVAVVPGCDSPSSEADAAAGADATVDIDSGHQELGFDIRDPQQREIMCSDYPDGYPNEAQNFADTDWLCTFAYDGVEGYLYVQSTPVDCDWSMVATPSFVTGTAEFSRDGVTSALDNAAYDHGGNHNIDTLSFDYAGKSYVYAHSSMGVGFRPCQPIDCMRVYDGTTLIDDGCTAERTLPIVCVQIGEGGSHETLEDRFEPCPS